MNQEERSKISQASEALDIVDIALFDCQFNRVESFPEATDVEYVQVWKRNVSFRRDESGEYGNVFLVKADLGVRLCDVGSMEADEPIIFAEIEASYVALYKVKKEIDSECLKYFAESNGVHNIWPFWRQFVFDIVQKSKLPHVTIPLIAGVPKSGD